MTSIDHRIALLNERINELEDELARFEAKTGFMNAETMLESAKAWIVRNPKAWKLLQSVARYSIENQRRFSIKRELEGLRENSDVVIGEDDYRISNSYSAVFVRLLSDEMPELRSLVTFRKSKVDRFFPWLRSL